MPKFTAISVENMKPTAVRREIADAGCVGLYLVIQPEPSGAKSWAVRYRHLKRPKKLTIGRADQMSLSEARKLATAALDEVVAGRDPAADKQEKKATSAAAAELRANDSVEAIAARFVAQHAERHNRPRTIAQVKRVFAKEVLPYWKGKSVHDVTKRDVMQVLDRIAEGRPILANRARAILSKWFSWQISRDIITTSPVAGTVPPAPARSRERVLKVEEIIALWNACEEIGEPFGPFVKLLLLTGQRYGEIAGMCWSEIDSATKTWTLPSARTKNGRQHTVPLSQQVLSIIEPRRNGGDRIFAIGSVSRRKRELDALAHIDAWVLHDLRRSAVTHMAEIGIAPHIIEACVNHIGAFKSGVAGIYNKASYSEPKSVALQTWADYIDRITGKAQPSNIVRLGGRP